MKVLALAAAAVLLSGPTWAAEPVTTNGFITSMTNQLNQRVDQFQAASPSIPANLTTMINSTQTFITGASAEIKTLNPLPNAVSPVQPFTIPAFTPVH
jgi:hypothetical protein